MCKILGLFQDFSLKLTNPRNFQDTFQIPELSRTCGNPVLNLIIKQLRLCLLSDSSVFSFRVSNICKSVANQLSVLTRLNNLLCSEGKRVLVNSYFMSNFNYCSLVWIFSNAASISKTKNLQKSNDISVK